VSEQIAAIRPTEQQLAWQRLRLGVFFHFGINTYFGKEWSDGTLPPSAFDPVDFDARQWVAVAKSAGATYVILTAKHHDGFCLWPTATTTYSVASSPWRRGKGDVVAGVAAACAEAGLMFGLYLSPWDRNAPSYPDREAYDDLYAAQLTELCTRYGRLGELWFDGTGSVGREYDWPRIMAVIDEHQPGAMVFNTGAPTIRWVGNENGVASDPVEYTVRETAFDNYTVVSSTLASALYLPPECDVSIRRGWFWHADEEPKDLDHLLAIFYRSIGLGANLLLNVPPDRRGLVPDADAARVAEFGAEIERRFGAPVVARLDRIGTRWSVRLPPGLVYDHLEIVERLDGGQRIRSHAVRDGDLVVCAGLTVGSSRLHAFPARTGGDLVLECEGDGAEIERVLAHFAGSSVVPSLPGGYEAPTDAPD